MTTTAVAAVPTLEIPLDQIMPHPKNRKRFNEQDLQELAGSIRALGQLTPALVRAIDGGYQLLAGERRWRAAKIATLPVLLCQVRELDDQAALEVLLAENNHREDPHPLEEAELYKELLAFKGNSPQSLAKRLHRSATYIYDRLKLLQLVPALKQSFLDGAIQLEHAIILARLTPAQQKDILGTDRQGHSVLFAHERTLLDEPSRKAISARELQAHVDKHIRFDATKIDPMLFPDTAAGLQLAQETGEKVVAITDLFYIPEEARDPKTRTFFPQAWKRADGKHGSKTCEHSCIGNMVAGSERGALFRVCVNKDKCKVHWPQQAKAKAQRAKLAASGDDSKAKAAAEQAKANEEARRVRLEAELARWQKAHPVLRKAAVAAIGELSITDLVTTLFKRWDSLPTEWKGLSARGRTADEALRHLGVVLFAEDAPYTVDDQWDIDTWIREGKRIGLDAKVVVDAAAPLPTEKAEKKRAGDVARAKKAAKRKGVAK